MNPLQALARADDPGRERFSRFAAVDLSAVSVEVAASAADFQTVAHLRASGFSRVLRDAAQDPVAWVDASDRAPGFFTLIGYGGDGEAVATLRVQDSRRGPLELARLVDIGALLAPMDHPAAQFSRLTALKRPAAMNVMFGLFKAAWSWCRDEGLASIVIATPRWSRPIYDYMLFSELGAEGRFAHPFLAGTEHACMKLPVQHAERVWRAGGQPLCGQFFDTDHPALRITSRL